MSLSNLQPGDILYTKDGRKSGNLTVIEVKRDHPLRGDFVIDLLVAISDYGNIVKAIYSPDSLAKQFYVATGKTTPTHKYHDYLANHPEYFI